MIMPSLNKLTARKGWGVFFTALFMLSSFPGLWGAERTVGTGGANTGYSGQKNLIYVPGKGYWIFFKATNSDRVVYRYSSDGIDWKAKDESGNWVTQADVFPFLQTAPDAAAPTPSVWYVSNLNRVYVAAADGGTETTGSGSTTNGVMADATGNKVFLRWGTLNNDGSITWDPTSGIRRQRMTLRLGTTTCQKVANGSNQWYDPRTNKSAVVVYSSSTGGDYVSVFADTNRSIITNGVYTGMGTIGVTNLRSDLTAYTGTDTVKVYSYCMEGSDTSFDATSELISVPTVAPILENGQAQVALGLRVDNLETSNAGDGAIVALSSGSARVTASDSIILTDVQHAIVTVGDEEGFGIASLNEINTSTAHFVWINDGGDLVYRKRVAVSSNTPTLTLDTSGTAALPIRHPTLSTVDKSGGGKDVYMAYTSADATAVKYVVCPSTAFDASKCSAVKTFKSDANATYAYPKLGFWGTPNESLPIIWSDTNNVYFDKIIVSSFAIPSVTAITTETVAGEPAYLSKSTYDLDITGTNFEIVNSTVIKFLVLKSSETQSEIKVSSTVWWDPAAGTPKTHMRATVTLSTFVTAGDYLYDWRLVFPDGQEYPSYYDRNRAQTINYTTTLNLPNPTIAGVSDQNGGYPSGGMFPNNNGTTGVSRALIINGSNFMNWTPNATTVPSTNTAAITFKDSNQNAISDISVASMTYGANHATITAFLKISTTIASGGPFQVWVTNPSSGSALTAGTTFYVTIPTASITSPAAGVSQGLTQVVGYLGFNQLVQDQTSVNAANVRVKHLTSGQFWNGTIMTTSFSDEEAKWKDVVAGGGTLSSGNTFYAYPFNTAGLAATYDGEFEIAARAKTSDGGRGDPYRSGFVSTVAVTLDRFPPGVSLSLPQSGSTNTINNITYTFSDIGTGVTISSIMVQDVNMGENVQEGSTTTWKAFDESGNLGASGVEIWLSTTSPNTPVTIFSPAIVGSVNVDINAGTSIKLPNFQSGRKYKIATRVKDGADFVVDQSTGGADNTSFRVIYDTHAPTVARSGPGGLSQSSNTATWMTSFSVASGTIIDNVADGVYTQHVFARVGELNNDGSGSIVKWLNPQTNLMDATLQPAQAWKDTQVTPTSTNTPTSWSWNGPSLVTNFVDGNVYRVEIYAQDGAGNSTGTATVPIGMYTGFLRLDPNPPSVTVVGYSTGALDNGSILLSTTSTVGLYQSTNPLTSIRIAASDSGSGVTNVQYNLRYNGAAGDVQWNALLGQWCSPSTCNPGNPDVWNAAGSTTTPNYQISLATAVSWIDGRNYYIQFKAFDGAGSNPNSIIKNWSFTFDKTAPTFAVTNISSNTTYGASTPISIAGTARDGPIGSDAQPADVEAVYVGVQRVSDNKWWSRLACSGDFWCANRDDNRITGVDKNNQNWSMGVDAGPDDTHFFNTTQSTDTFFLYVWTQDLVTSQYGYQNKTASSTLNAVFRWEVQVPSSSVVSPLHDVWYSSNTTYQIASIIGTAADLPVSGKGSGGSVILQQVQVYDPQVTGLCYGSSGFDTSCSNDTTWKDMSPQSSSWTFNTGIGSANSVWESMQNGKRYRVSLRAKDSALNSSNQSAPNVEVPPTPAYPSQNYNVRWMKIDKLAPVTVATQPANGAQPAAVLSVAGTASDAESGLGVTYVDVCLDSAGNPNMAACLTSTTSAGGFTGNRKFFQVFGSNWVLDTSQVPVGGNGWVDGSSYHVLTFSTDTVDNIELTQAAAQDNKNHVKFTFTTSVPPANTVILGPNGPDLTNYNFSNVTITSGTGTNLRASQSVRIHLQRLTSPTSWWYEPTQTWVDVDTWTWVNHAAGVWSQGITGSAAFIMNNSSYSFTSVGCNDANKCQGEVGQNPITQRNIVIDNSKPTGVILAPGSQFVKTLPTLSGTATDLENISQPSLDKVFIRFKDLNAGTYWAGSSFTALIPQNDIPTSFTPATTVNWSSATAANSSLLDGKNYRILLAPQDKAGNKEGVENNMISFTVTFDTSIPNSGMLTPTPNQVLNAVTSITGTSADPSGVWTPNLKSDLDRVELQIYDLAGDKYWHDGAGQFVLGQSSFNIVSGTDSWTYSHGSLSSQLTSAKKYLLLSQAYDKAANSQNGFAANVSSYSFVWDKDPPTTLISSPIATGYYKPSQLDASDALRGTASDPTLPGVVDKLNKVQIHLSYLLAGTSYYWTGSAFSSYTVTDATAWQTTIGTDTWRYPFSGSVPGPFGDWVSDKSYTLKTRAFDKSQPMGANGGNEQNPWTSVSFTVDGTPPVSRVTSLTDEGFISAAPATISGTSYGGGSGLQTGAAGLQLRIFHVYGGDTYYWKGTNALGWSSSTVTQLPVEFTASASTLTWTYPPASYDPPTVSTNGQVYKVSINGFDLAANLEAGTTISVTADFLGPTVTFSTPTTGANAFYGTNRAIATLYGNATDSPAGPQPPVLTQISNISETGATKPKWDGSQFAVVASSWLATVGIPWSYTGVNWVNNKRYKIEGQVNDTAGNPTSPIPNREFIYDVNAPSSTILVPDAAYHNTSQIAVLNGTAADWVNYPS
ncbi:MAG: hypothetical protein HY399_05805, partial [Elusimicrobia bacterium]|nr:hypothetical protein [Elusimicrobiota bacterium]